MPESEKNRPDILTFRRVATPLPDFGPYKVIASRGIPKQQDFQMAHHVDPNEDRYGCPFNCLTSSQAAAANLVEYFKQHNITPIVHMDKTDAAHLSLDYIACVEITGDQVEAAIALAQPWRS